MRTMPMNKAEFEKVIQDIQGNQTECELDLRSKSLGDNRVAQLAKVLGANR